MKSTILQLIEKHKLISIAELCNTLRNATHNEVVEHLQQLQSDGEIIKIDNRYRFPTDEEKQSWKEFHKYVNHGVDKGYIPRHLVLDIVHYYANQKSN